MRPHSVGFIVAGSPGYRDFIRSLITGPSPAGVALVKVPATISEGNHKADEIQGQTRRGS